MNKKKSRIRRAANTRFKLRKLNVFRLLVHRTLKNIYAQIIEPINSHVLVSASSIEKEFKKSITNKKDKSYIIGKTIAERALNKGVKQVSFDRSGFKYHGRIKILADSARKFGLLF